MSERILKVILLVIFFLIFINYLVFDFIHAQSCSTIEQDNNLTCEELVTKQASNCEYIFLRWKKVEPLSREIMTCQEIRGNQEI